MTLINIKVIYKWLEGIRIIEIIVTKGSNSSFKSTVSISHSTYFFTCIVRHLSLNVTKIDFKI